MTERPLPTSELRTRLGEPLVERPTHSEAVVRRMSMQFVAPLEDIAALAGTRVKLMDHTARADQELLGNVVAVQGRDITVVPDTKIVYHKNTDETRRPIRDAKPRLVKGYFLSTDPYNVEWVDAEDSTVKTAIFEHFPSGVDVKHGYHIEISFYQKDPALDSLLEHALKQFPEVSTMQELAAVTRYVRDTFPYREYQSKERIWSPPGLGKELTEHGSECRQIAGFAMALLALHGIDAKPLGSFHPSEKDGHMYLGIDTGIEGQQERIVVDPTWNLVGTYPEVLRKLLDRRSTLKFHIPESAVPFVLKPDWN